MGGVEGRSRSGIAGAWRSVRLRALCSGCASAALMLSLAQGLNATLMSGPAQARGGAGGAAGTGGLISGGPGGAGGDADPLGAPPGADGVNGSGGVDGTGFGGSGGGGGSANPSSSSVVTDGQGGRGGNGGNGGSGDIFGGNGGGGGGGGAGGDGVVSSAAAVTATGPVTGGSGGNGGNGGEGVSFLGIGGGGGSGGSGGGGGAGFVLQQSGTLNVSANVTGGRGGAGGNSGQGASGGITSGGNGGNGGAAIVLQQGGDVTIEAGARVNGGSGGQAVNGGKGGDAGAGIVLQQRGNIEIEADAYVGGGLGGQGDSAGKGGAGGAGIVLQQGGDIRIAANATVRGLGGGADSGLAGDGGVGIIGAGLTIDNSGSIIGGAGGIQIRANAITFTGGDNFLANTGTITGGIAVQGGSFAPALTSSAIGTALDIGAAPLTFSSGTSYNIRVSPTANDSVTTSGVATLTGATVNAAFAPGSYVTRQYTVLTASGGRNGEFSSLANSGLPASFIASLSYDPTHVFLDLALSYTAQGGLNGNQQAVANTLEQFFQNTGGVPLAFATLDARGLSQASGEIATTAAQAAFDAQSQFLNILTDPFTSGPQGIEQSSPALGYAASRESKAYDAFAAFATKASPAANLEQRWRVFGAGYGGNARIDGNTATGSHDTTSRVWGLMGGAAYAVLPQTHLGFAFGGGGTSFGLSDGLGAGRSDMFQAGVFARHGLTQGGYLSGALAYGWHDVHTDRLAPTGEVLRGGYKADVFSGRIEAGWRITTQFAGVTPYAAGQAISYRMPDYRERGNGAADNFALNYAQHSVTATRSELGARLDRTLLLDDALLTLRGRLAWAHNFDPSRDAVALFTALPGTGFIVNGAAVAPDAALVSAGAEIGWRNGFSFAATFEGEFSGNIQSYAGKGSVRYRW